MVDPKLLDEVYEALLSVCGDHRWRETWQGQILEEFADQLDKPPPYMEMQ